MAKAKAGLAHSTPSKMLYVPTRRVPQGIQDVNGESPHEFCRGYGHAVVITERARPAARLEAAVGHDDPNGRLARPECPGLARVGLGSPPDQLLRGPGPTFERAVKLNTILGLTG